MLQIFTLLEEIRKFMNGMDAYILIELHKRTIITEESNKKETHIPAIAKEQGVDCITLAEFLNKEFSLKLERK